MVALTMDTDRAPSVGYLTLGVDIGQKVDPTAIALVEAVERGSADAEEMHFLVRFLERLPLGTPYPDVTRRIATIVDGLRARIGRQGIDDAQLALFVDATGVGQPVCDVLEASGVPVTPVYFTHGDRRIKEHGEIKLGKGWLVSRLKTLAQTDRLHLPKTAEAVAMRQELLDYEIRVDQDANEKYGAFKVGTHDDLVTALGLAVQEDPGPGFAPLDDDVAGFFIRHGLASVR